MEKPCTFTITCSEWLLIQYSRMDDDRLNYVRLNQLELLREDEIHQAQIEGGLNRQGRIFSYPIPSLVSFILEARCRKWSTSRCRIGPPDYFITITYNPSGK